MDTSRKFMADLLSEAGVQVDGGAPWDLRVKDERFFREVMLRKNLGLGEGYMLGWWDCERVDEFICRVLRSGAADRVRGCWRLLVRVLPSLVFNLQNLSRAKVVARRHYDLGNDLFLSFLDPYLQYSCAYFKDLPAGSDPLAQPDDEVSRDLEQAQRAKMRLICEKLELRPGETLLDIGCGWGGLARFAAEEYGCAVTGVNISRRQIDFAREFCRGLPVDIVDLDYRLLDGTYDKIVSVGMFEHVGHKNYQTFMGTAARCLKPDGLFLLHTIGSNVTARKSTPGSASTSSPTACCPASPRYPGPPSPGSSWRTCTTSGPTTTGRSCAGCANSAAPGPSCTSATATASGACGNTTCNPAPAASAPATYSCGSSCSPKSAGSADLPPGVKGSGRRQKNGLPEHKR